MIDTEKFRRKLVKADLQRMNLPEDYWQSKIVHVSEDSREAVERYLRNMDVMVQNSAGLIVCGPKGSGKTTVSALIAKEARSRGYTVLFIRLWEFREMLRARLQFDSDSTFSERAREVDVLVLDDLRAEDATERFFTISEIAELVRSRTSRRKVTIVTTRLDKQALSQPGMSGLLDVLLLFPVTGPNLHESRKQALRQVVFGN